jgi:hypothetical protein
LKDLKKTAEQLGFLKTFEKLQILEVGPFREIRLHFDENPQTFNKEISKKIKEKWQEHLTKVPGDFPGTVASLTGFKLREKILSLNLRKSCYDFFIGTRNEGELRALDTRDDQRLDQDFTLPLSLSAISVSADNFLTCALREEVGLAKGKLSVVPEGYLDPDYHTIYLEYNKGKSQLSLFCAIASELYQELGVTWFSKMEALALVQDCVSSQQPTVVVRLMLALTKDEIKESLNNTGKELRDYIFVKNDIEAIKELSKEFEWTPHNIGKLVFHFALSSDNRGNYPSFFILKIVSKKDKMNKQGQYN